MISDEQLRVGVATLWGLTDATIARHRGGMNSATWFVTAGERRWVAKSVPAQAARRLRAGLAVAAAVQRAGIPAGAPMPTVDGELVADLDDYPVALLAFVPGVPLTGGDQSLIGTTLARVHNALAGVIVDDVEQFHWVDSAADHLAVRPWIRESVAAAVETLDEVGPRGLLHTDPAPEAFRLDRDGGVCGLIDWSIGLYGPLLYDIASAVMYAGGPSRAGALLCAYLDHTDLVEEAVIETGLPSMVRFRWAVQADYFAQRIATGDLTGIASAGENEKGLEDARRALASSEP